MTLRVEVFLIFAYFCFIAFYKRNVYPLLNSMLNVLHLLYKLAQVNNSPINLLFLNKRVSTYHLSQLQIEKNMDLLQIVPKKLILYLISLHIIITQNFI